MKKKIVIVTILSLVLAGVPLAIYAAVKFMKNKKINKERARLESYVEKYLHGNESLMEFVGTLSDEQVKLERLRKGERFQLVVSSSTIKPVK